MPIDPKDLNHLTPEEVAWYVPLNEQFVAVMTGRTIISVGESIGENLEGHHQALVGLAAATMWVQVSETLAAADPDAFAKVLLAAAKWAEVQ